MRWRIGDTGMAATLLLLAALVAPSFNFVALPPVLPEIAAHFGGGQRGLAIAQMAEALPFFGLAFGGACAGWLLDRLGIVRGVMVSGVCIFIAGLGGFVADNAPVLLLSCTLIGLAAALVTSALAALTGTLVAEQRRTKVLGVQVAASDMCTLIGGAAAALLARRLGWHGPFLIFVGFGVFLMLCLLVARFPATSPRAEPGGILRMVRLGWPTYLGSAFVFLLVATQATQLPFYLEQLGFSTAAGRAVITTFALFAAMCGSISYAAIQGRVAPWLVQALAVAAAVAGLIGYTFWSGGLGYGLGCTFLIGLGIGLTVPGLFALALNNAPEGLRGHSIGLLNVAIFLGSFLSPIVLSPVAALLGYRGLYGFIAIVVVGVGAWRVLRIKSGRPGVTHSATAIHS